MTILTAQQRLKTAGFDPGPLDGQWGARCDAALDAALAAIPKPTDKPALLTARDMEDAAHALEVSVATVKAVRAVESGPLGGFAPDGRPNILFEPHIFSRLTQHRFDATHGGVSYRAWKTKPYPATQAARWGQLDYACDLDRDAALQSASYGLFQIMGFNFKVCGFPNVEAFVEAMRAGEREHLMAFVAFVKGNGLAPALAAGDFVKFAAGYNGPGQAAAYGQRLAKAHAAALT